MASDDDDRRLRRPISSNNGNSNSNSTSTSHPLKKPKPSPITLTDLHSEFSHHDPTIARINNGSFGCCPATVLSAKHRHHLAFLRQPDSFFSTLLKPSILTSRTLIKSLIHAQRVDQISIVDNVTTAAAIVLQHTGRLFSDGKLSQNDVAVTLSCAFPAVKTSFSAYVARFGGTLVEVDLPFPLNSPYEIIDKFKKTLHQCKISNQKVRLAIIDHISSMPSVIIPIKELIRVCREEGVDQVFVDGAHAIGSVEVDMNEIDADFYVSNLHKWFFCPPSVAVLYCRKTDNSADLHHPIVTHEYGNGLALESSWIGTRDYSSQLVIPDAINFVNRFEGGIDGIMRRNHEKVVEMANMLAAAWGTGLGAPPEMCANMVMIGLPNSLGVLSDSDALALRIRLRDGFKVEVPIYYRAPKEGEAEPVTGYVRISYQVYNKCDDYFKFRDAINQLVKDGVTCADLSH